jgi:serine/threonine protein phosphatase PrpC
LLVEYAALSTTGPVRERNEDHLGWGALAAGAGAILLGSRAEFVPHDLPDRQTWGPVGAIRNERPGRGLLFAVADGLGGYGGGDVASSLALTELLEQAGRADGAGIRPAAVLRNAYSAANQRVFDAALSGQGTRKMQTTLTTLLFSPGEVHVAHVGDCRAYRLRGDALELLTTDHTQVMEMLRMKLISPEQAADHPARYALTRSLGAELIVRTDIGRETLVDGDAYLLCSDGVWSKVDASEIAAALRADCQSTCEQLVELAVERGGEDNASALAMRVHSSGRAPEAASGWKRFFRS